MNQEIRIKRIRDIVDRDLSNEELKNDLLKEAVMWDGDLRPFFVHKVPLSFLIYNKYNGRILSRTKSLEKQNRLIDVETDEGRDLIEKLLWDSKLDRNKKTLEDIETNGQKRIGIITRDGVIIDGNRRAMLLNKIDRTQTFKAIILPVTLEENPIEIERLETTYQMGEDEKLGYNPIEKYLKAKQLYSSLIKEYSKEEAVESISDWMGESDTEVKKYLDTLAVMDEYLDFLEYDGIYTQLDGREDQFLSLTKWLSIFYNKESRKVNWAYNNDDVDSLKEIAFYYLRIRNEYDGKEFRNLAEGTWENHFFGNKEVWDSFSTQHDEIVDRLPEEPEIDFNSNNLEKHLNERDKLFFESSKSDGEKSDFLENLNDHKTKIGYNKAAGAPEKLVKKAADAFAAIKQSHSAFSRPEVQNLVEEFAGQVTRSLRDKSPVRLLNHIIHLFESLDVEDIPDSEKAEVEKQSKRIQQIAYRIHKAM